MTYTW